MNNKTKVLIVIVYTAVVAASAYYLAPQKIKIEKEIVTVEVEKKTQVVNKDKKLEKKTTTKKNADGSSTTETTTVITDNSTTKDTEDKTINNKETDKKEIIKSKGHTTITALAGVDINRTSEGVTYGASVNRDLLGPIGISIYGLSNGNLGCGISLTF